MGVGFMVITRWVRLRVKPREMVCLLFEQLWAFRLPVLLEMLDPEPPMLERRIEARRSGFTRSLRFGAYPSKSHNRLPIVDCTHRKKRGWPRFISGMIGTAFAECDAPFVADQYTLRKTRQWHLTNPPVMPT